MFNTNFASKLQGFLGDDSIYLGNKKSFNFLIPCSCF